MQLGHKNVVSGGTLLPESYHAIAAAQQHTRYSLGREGNGALPGVLLVLPLRSVSPLHSLVVWAAASPSLAAEFVLERVRS